MEKQVIIRLPHGYYRGGVYELPETLPTIDTGIMNWHILIGEIKENECEFTKDSEMEKPKQPT